MCVQLSEGAAIGVLGLGEVMLQESQVLSCCCAVAACAGAAGAAGCTLVVIVGVGHLQ